MAEDDSNHAVTKFGCRETTAKVREGVAMQLKELKGSAGGCDTGDLKFGNLGKRN